MYFDDLYGEGKKKITKFFLEWLTIFESHTNNIKIAIW